MKTERIALATIASVLFLSFTAAANKPAPSLVLQATYDTGLGADGAEIISIRHTDSIAAVTNIDGSVDVLDLSNPLDPKRLHRVEIDTSAGTPNSVAVHPHHDYFLVVIGAAGAVGTVAAYRLSDGSFLASAPVGIQPDSIAIAPNGQHAVVANEAEGVGIGLDGGAGSLSIVDLTGFNGVKGAPLPVTNVPLPSLAGLPGFSTQRTDDLARLPIDNTPNTIEPESVAFTENSQFAYVTLQENNGVVRLDVRTRELTFFGLGTTTHDADLTVDGAYAPVVNALTALREPDGIALDQTGRFFVTADEGDTRNGAGSSGPRGGRTVSVFDAHTGALLGDTGSQLDAAAAAAPPQPAGLYPDSRSNRGGSEPEVLDLTHYRGMTLVAVGLERANAVALINLDDPAAPKVIDVAAAGTGPEGIKFFQVKSRLYVAAANEVSGTVSIFEVVF
jgi:DNA-binding beta-propeller fold protein YncE